MNVLLAIQDEDSMGLLLALCKETECEAIVTENSYQVVEKLLDEGEGIDILFLDLDLPGLDIEYLLPAINEIMRELPVIIVAERPDLSEEIKIRERKIFYFALKPLNPAEIEQVFHAAIYMVASRSLETESVPLSSSILKKTEGKKTKEKRWFNTLAKASRTVVKKGSNIDQNISKTMRLLIPNHLAFDQMFFSAYISKIDRFFISNFNYFFNSFNKPRR